MAYKPFKAKKNQDIYTKNNKQTNVTYKNEGRVKLFGFRSGLAYKMIPALLYYVFALFYIGAGIYGEIRYFEFEPIDIVLMVFKYIFWIILFFSPAIFLSDFKYRDVLPFFKKREVGSSLIGLIIVFMFCYFMANINLYCMSQTYKDSVIKHTELMRQEQMEKQSEFSDIETTPENQENNTEQITTIN